MRTLGHSFPCRRHLTPQKRLSWCSGPRPPTPSGATEGRLLARAAHSWRRRAPLPHSMRSLLGSPNLVQSRGCRRRAIRTVPPLPSCQARSWKVLTRANREPFATKPGANRREQKVRTARGHQSHTIAHDQTGKAGCANAPNLNWHDFMPCLGLAGSRSPLPAVKRFESWRDSYISRSLEAPPR